MVRDFGGSRGVVVVVVFVYLGCFEGGVWRVFESAGGVRGYRVF